MPFHCPSLILFSTAAGPATVSVPAASLQGSKGYYFFWDSKNLGTFILVSQIQNQLVFKTWIDDREFEGRQHPDNTYLSVF